MWSRSLQSNDEELLGAGIDEEERREKKVTHGWSSDVVGVLFARR